MDQALYLTYMMVPLNKHCIAYLNQERKEHVMQHGLVTRLTYPGSLVDSFGEVWVPLQQIAYASGAAHIHPVIVIKTITFKKIYMQCS